MPYAGLPPWEVPVVKGRTTRIIGVRVSDQEWEALRDKALKAGKGESVGLYFKRCGLKEGLRSHKGSRTKELLDQGEIGDTGETGSEGEG